MAYKYFDDKNPLGRKLVINQSIPLVVTGVLSELPTQNHFHFDFLASMETVKKIYGNKMPSSWVWNPCWTYILVKKGVTKSQVEKILPEFVEENFEKPEGTEISSYLQPLTDIHLKSNLDYEIEPNSSMINIYILISIALFILLIANVNFMNLATASYSKRANEIAVKKIHGAQRRQLILQFIMEAVFIAFIALFIGLALVEILLPAFNGFTDKNIEPDFLFKAPVITGILCITLFAGILSGLYPAFYLSSFEPIHILRKQLKLNIKGKKARKILVVFQFVISITLIINTLISNRQLNTLINTDPGFNPDSIIVFPVHHTKLAYYFDDLKKDILENRGVSYVTCMDYLPGIDHNTQEFRQEGFTGEGWNFYPTLVVDHDFTQTFNIEILAGRSYNKDSVDDAKKAILINEAMVKYQGWKSNEEALGKRFYSMNGKERVIGVFKNFNAKSLRNPASPFVLNIKEEMAEIAMFRKYAAVKYNNKIPVKEVIQHIKNCIHKMSPKEPFEYFYLNDELAELYSGERNISNLAEVFTFLAILIASIGLFGLSSFTIELRRNEIGIRKVHGATTKDIIALISKEFLSLILIANLIAWGLAYLSMSFWLNNFVVKAPFRILDFFMATVLSVLVSQGIVIIRTDMASIQNPVNSLDLN
ncbi:MAG: hypothetical protein C0594_05585 [Marinilabiliales bacterium]|nr:MAG: hypothetical protein C0594_05585 [Marinilabiliales bacterium]